MAICICEISNKNDQKAYEIDYQPSKNCRLSSPEECISSIILSRMEKMLLKLHSSSEILNSFLIRLGFTIRATTKSKIIINKQNKTVYLL